MSMQADRRTDMKRPHFFWMWITIRPATMWFLVSFLLNIKCWIYMICILIDDFRFVVTVDEFTWKLSVYFWKLFLRGSNNRLTERDSSAEEHIRQLSIENRYIDICLHPKYTILGISYSYHTHIPTIHTTSAMFSSYSVHIIYLIV